MKDTIMYNLVTFSVTTHHIIATRPELDELERLTKDELIEMELWLQQPAKTSCTSSKPPPTDHKARREQARPGGAKPGHEGHSRVLCTFVDCVVGHALQQCRCCSITLLPDLSPSERSGEREL